MRWAIVVGALLIARLAIAEPVHVVVPVAGPALSFVGVDLDAARGSPSLMAAVEHLVGAYAIDVSILSGRSLVIATIPGAPAPRTIPSVPVHTLGFGAIWLDASAQRRLAQVLPDLGGVQWIAGTLSATRTGVEISGSAAFADPYAAARLAVAIAMGRKLATTQLSPAVAAAADKIALTAMGSTIRITATWSEADLAALLASL